MTEESNRPIDGKKPLPKIIWLFCAFIPSAVAMACLNDKTANFFGEFFLLLLIILDATCSLISAAKLLGGVKKFETRFVLSIFLGLFFFALNAFITMLVGCSRMGR